MNKPIKAREYNLPQTKRDALFVKPLKRVKEYLPRNLENLEKLEKYDPDKNAKLRYFNDKYIFIEHKKEDNSTTIQVVPFEELF